MGAPKNRYNTSVQFTSMEAYFRLKNIAAAKGIPIGEVLEQWTAAEEKKLKITFDPETDIPRLSRRGSFSS